MRLTYVRNRSKCDELIAASVCVTACLLIYKCLPYYVFTTHVVYTDIYL